MTTPHQIPLPQDCPFCGRSIQPLHELAELSDQAVAALESRRLALPQIVPDILKTLARDLRCLAGACGGTDR